MAPRRTEPLEQRLHLSVQFPQTPPAAIVALSDPTLTPADETLAAMGTAGAEPAPARFTAPAAAPAAAFVATEGVNNPFGVAQGIFPGRVAWAFDPQAVNQSWDAAAPAAGYWWQASNSDQVRVNALVGQTVRWLTGKATDQAAWDALFRSFNRQRGNGAVGYVAGERIAIKVNLNNTWAWEYGRQDPRQYQMGDNNWADTSPQAMLGLLDQLVNKAGVRQQDIYLIEPGRYFVDRLFDVLHAAFPDVHYVDDIGINGRERSARSATAVMRFASGQQGYLPQEILSAKYLINLSALKKHEMNGITVAGKNHYGSIWTTDQSDWSPSSLHNTLPVNLTGMGKYSQLVDLNGHPQLGGKTLLYMVDALWGGWHSNRDYSVPVKWQMAPFYGRYPSSIFASQDFVAIDSVSLDFIAAEDALHSPPLGAGQPVQPYVDNYLHEAALAGKPGAAPSGVAYSGTTYRPDGTATLTSMGVHEHWNNAASKQYSRNLGTGKGIELVSSTPNAAPTDITITGSSIAENRPANSAVGTLGAVDADPAEPFSFVLEGGTGGEDNSAFWIDGNVLKTRMPFDFEARNTFNVRVRVIDHVFRSGQTAERLKTGYGFTEGPAVDSRGSVYFTAKNSNLILRYDPATGLVTTISSSSNSSNGLDIDYLGRRIACEESLHRVTRTNLDGSVTVLASTYNGIALNSPNDVVADAFGGVYFTDPNWGTHPQPYEAVYYVNPSGTIYRIITDLVRPNGIALTPNGKTLYVADDMGRAIYAYDVQTSGLVANKRLFATIPAGGNHGPDGVLVDTNGMVYAAVDHAIKAWDPNGNLKGTLALSEDPTNLALAPDGQTLYITTQQGSLYRVVLDTLTYDEAMVISVRNVAEVTPTITGFSTDTGTPGDRLTSDRTPTILGTCEPLMTVRMYRNGVAQGTTTARADGTWAFSDSAAPLSDGTYLYTAAASDGLGNTTPLSVALGITIDGTAPVVSGIRVNGGAVQRSMVTMLELTFSEQVDLAPDALVLRLHSGASVPNVGISVANPSGDKMRYVLTFSGQEVIAGSLPDGIYDLVIQAAGVMDGAGTHLAIGTTLTFHRLFGDSDGNKIINALDYARLKQTFGRAPSDPLFNSAFDFDGNNLINALDLARFRQRYGMSFSY